MQGDLEAQSSPQDEPEGSAAEPSEESASQSAATSSAADISATMNALIRGTLPPSPDDSTSKPDDDIADFFGSKPDGESAPSGDVKPDDGSAPGRRGAAAEIARLKAENERTQAELDALKPKPVDASAEAQRTARDREQRYRRLRDKPDTDQDWTSDDWDFVQSEKQKRAAVPELQQHYDAIVADDLKANEDAFNGWVSNFRRGLLADMATAADVPGVDFAAVKAAKTFAERDRILYDAGAASRATELKTLREENAQLKRERRGDVRVAVSGGRSSPGRTQDVNGFMNDLIRQGRPS